jgi:hypothetical protein
LAPSRSSRKTTTFAAKPAAAVSISGRPEISGGAANRRTASTTTQPATPQSRAALASAASTSAR